MRKGLLYVMLLSCLACQRAEHHNIGLRNLGCFPPILRDSIAAAIGQCYGLEVVALPEQPLPEAYFNDEKGPRYFADSLLKFLDRGLPPEVDCCIGFTMADIYTADKDESGQVRRPASRYANWGIFGLGETPGRCCVISIARLRAGEAALLRERAIKVSLHEVGHTMGLPHCPNTACLMTGAAGKLSTVDRTERKLCAGCRAKLGLL